MSLSYYADVQVHGGITKGLRNRGVVVLTAQQDGYDTAPDPALLNRALALGYVLFTQDVDLLIEAARRQRAGEVFAGVVYAHQIHVPVGRCIADLELMAKVYEPIDMMNRVVYLPI
jgi:predicted nuclease of predicted toxin-antitoxin system